MTSKHNRWIRSSEEFLNRHLQLVVHLLHTNELPLPLVFAILDGGTSGPGAFAGPVDKKIRVLHQNGHVLSSTKCSSQFFFPKLLRHVINDLSTDQ